MSLSRAMPPKRGSPASSPTKRGYNTPSKQPGHTVLMDVHSAEQERPSGEPAADERAAVGWGDVAGDVASDDLTEPEPEPEPPLTARQELEPVDLREPEEPGVSDTSMRESVAEQEGLLGGGDGGYSASPAGRVVTPAGATLAQTYVTFFKSFVGIAILGLPHAFSLAGYILAPLVFAFIAYISFYCMRLLLKTKNKILAAAAINSSAAAATAAKAEEAGSMGGKAGSMGAAGSAAASPSSSPLILTNPSAGMGYQDVARACLGPYGQQLTEFCLVTSQAGFLIGYLIFIGQNTPPSLLALGGPETSSTFCVVIASIFLTPLVCLRSIKKLSSSALLADAAILFGVGTVIYYDVLYDLAPHVDDRNLEAFKWNTFPLYYGSAVFSMEGIGKNTRAQEIYQSLACIYTSLTCYAACVFTSINAADRARNGRAGAI